MSTTRFRGMGTMALVSALAVTLTACGSSTDGSTGESPSAGTSAGSGVRIAFVTNPWTTSTSVRW